MTRQSGMLAKVQPLLEVLPDGSKVACVTLLGSLCPVTRGHVQGFQEARRILLAEPGSQRPVRLEEFNEVLGFISLNSDSHVGYKMVMKGEASLSKDQRSHLVGLAVEDHAWIAQEQYEGECIPVLGELWPKLTFVHFTMNGADDVAKYKKFLWSSPTSRFITMGRPGSTEEVVKGMARAGIDPDDGYCILGPELPDISSTAVRRALKQGDQGSLASLLHPRVAEWCLENKPFGEEA